MADDELLVFVIDDEIGIVKALTRVLELAGCTVKGFDNGADAIAAAQEISPAIILCDQRLPNEKGMEILSQFKELCPDSFRIIISGYSDFNDIITGFNTGSIQKFISKPWDNDELIKLIDTFKKRTRLPFAKNDIFNHIITNTPIMESVFKKVEKFSLANAPVFIYGETGTGKELIASAIHKGSLRSQKPFISFNCANFSGDLMESQLFGHTKGSFTGASSNQAGLLDELNGGTLFLDEVTSIPLDLQAKLLRVIQERRYTPIGSFKEKSFDAQIISASNKSLKDSVQEGSFREDLRYRLEVLPIEIPPLRERKEDVLLLINHFASQSGNTLAFTNEAKKLLTEFNWPGNIRQLENLVTYLCATKENESITVEDIPEEYKKPGASPINHERNQPIDLETLKLTLEKNKFNKAKTAKDLGISRMSLYRYLKSFDS